MTELPQRQIMVVGAGSWGTALALVLARNGHRTLLWDCLDAHLERLLAEGCNNYHLPGHEFPATLTVVRRFTPLPAGVRHVLLVTPCAGLTDVLAQLQALPKRDFSICLACKGIEPNTLELNHLLVQQYLPEAPLAVLSGPSFAQEVAAGLPTAVTIAAREAAVAADFAALFHCETFRTYTHDDIVGVQVGGAVKNVMAIAAGIADGLRFGANARAALIARGLAEIMRLGQALGGRRDTFMGLAGLGDLALTCTDDQSRNRRFGLALARGSSPEQALAEIGQAVEGLHTTRVVCALAHKHGVDMPISAQVLQVIDGQASPQQAVHELLTREPKAETG
ncbi:MAG: NAD(P)-dependent glycerol-3-phosphate dehydrogenase [Gammaproteobacteria bacterium]|nr:NAD(P)-dependent glycerol-3-phosphate dehydrogenase [Gammaproteobacteria bacterium]